VCLKKKRGAGWRRNKKQKEGGLWRVGVRGETGGQAAAPKVNNGRGARRAKTLGLGERPDQEVKGHGIKKGVATCMQAKRVGHSRSGNSPAKRWSYSS
jgi:hypothetical protein